MEPFREGLIKASVGIASISAIGITAISLFRFTIESFLVGLITGIIGGVFLCVLMALNWSPVELKPRQAKEGWEVFGLFLVFILGGFLVPYVFERLFTPNSGGAILVSFGIMISILFAYLSVQMWRYRPRL